MEGVKIRGQVAEGLRASDINKLEKVVESEQKILDFINGE